MIIEETPFHGLLILKPKVFKDSRGFFMESFNSLTIKKLGINYDFVQDNQSLSKQGTLRGLHFQNPHPQGKLCRVIKGAVWDVVVDIRQDSPTFGQSFSIELSETNFLQLWIPPGFAHGFQVLSKEAEFFYKCTDYYDFQTEHCLAWDDLALNIEWKRSENLIISEKDKKGIKLQDFHKNILF